MKQKRIAAIILLLFYIAAFCASGVTASCTIKNATMTTEVSHFASLYSLSSAAVLVLPVLILLLFLALCLGMVKLEQVKQTGDFLSSLFPLLFIPTVAGVMEVWDLIADNLLPIVITIALPTVITFAVSGLVTQKLLRKEGKDHD